MCEGDYLNMDDIVKHNLSIPISILGCVQPSGWIV